MVAKKVLPCLATGALGSLGGLAMNKILKRGRGKTGGCMIPIDKITYSLSEYASWKPD